ncbi:hypothetical protein [Ideonella sp.]|uniref:hypothetical protein n=1 Tax=Ideonella sp. TaxID=1929293 RepID=UPI0035B157A1
MITAVVLAPSIVLVDARTASRTHTAGLIRNRWPDARVHESADLAGALAEAAELAQDTHPTELFIVDLAGAAAADTARALRERHPSAQVAVVGGTAPAGCQAVAAPLSPEGVEQLLALVGWEA